VSEKGKNTSKYFLFKYLSSLFLEIKDVTIEEKLKQMTCGFSGHRKSLKLQGIRT